MSFTSDDDPPFGAAAHGVGGGHSADDPDRPRTELRLPPLRFLLIRPQLAFQWAIAAIEGWFCTREWIGVIPGVPFLIAVIWLAVLMIETPSRLIEQVRILRGQIQEPSSREQPQLHELRLRAVAGLVPNDHLPLLELARLQASLGQFDDAVALMQRLAEFGEVGIPDAHMWLVQDAMSEDPHYKCSADCLEKHLRAVLQATPGRVEAHALLSAVLLKRGELMLAERSLQAAADLAPRYHLPLIQLRRSMRRADVTNESIRQATGKVAAEVVKHPRDVETRLALARLQLMLQQFADALKVLEEGRQLSDLPVFRRVMAEAHTIHAAALLDAGTMNRDQSATIIATALGLDPLNITTVELADRLSRLDADLPPAVIAACTEKWREAFRSLPERFDVRLSLCRMLELNNEPDAALELLQPLLEKHPELNSKSVELLIRAGRPEAARTEAEKSLEALAAKPDDRRARRTAAECLLVLREFGKVRSMLLQENGDPPLDPAERLLFGFACLQEFDALCGRPRKPGPGADYWIPDVSALSAEQLQQLPDLLRQASRINPIRLDVADRLARLAMLELPIARTAEEMLLQLRADEQQSAEILNQLGAHAVIHERYSKAREWLEQGNLLSDGRNPAILNNLAIAIIRGKLDPPQRALLLVNDGLKLLPDNAELLSTRGEIHVALSLWENARADLEQSLAIRGGRPKVHRLLEIVYRGLKDLDNEERHRAAAEALEKDLLAQQAAGTSNK